MKAMKKKVIFFWIGGMKWNEIEWLTGCSFHSLNGGRSNWLYVFGPGNSNSFLLHSPFIFHMPQRLSSLQQRQLNQRRQESKWMNNEVAGLFFCGDGLWPITPNNSILHCCGAVSSPHKTKKTLFSLCCWWLLRWASHLSLFSSLSLFARLSAAEQKRDEEREAYRAAFGGLACRSLLPLRSTLCSIPLISFHFN